MSEQLEAASQVNLETLRLKPGLPLKLIMPERRSVQHKAKLLAAVRGQSVMVALDNSNSLQAPPRFEIDGGITIGGFTGQHDFMFTARITQLFQLPFPYIALSWPGEVTAKLVRKVERQKAGLPATLSLPDNGMNLDVTLSDISVAGAMVQIATPAVKVGQQIVLTFDTRFEAETVELALTASVRYINETAPDGYQVGVQFNDMGLTDRLKLHYVVQTCAARTNNAII